MSQEVRKPSRSREELADLKDDPLNSLWRAPGQADECEHNFTWLEEASQSGMVLSPQTIIYRWWYLVSAKFPQAFVKDGRDVDHLWHLWTPSGKGLFFLSLSFWGTGVEVVESVCVRAVEWWARQVVLVQWRGLAGALWPSWLGGRQSFRREEGAGEEDNPKHTRPQAMRETLGEGWVCWWRAEQCLVAWTKRKAQQILRICILLTWS